LQEAQMIIETALLISAVVRRRDPENNQMAT
jgi:hypothetical protein